MRLFGKRHSQVGPPEEFKALYEHVATCSKCGFCQPQCPIFRATEREGYVARGKVALYRNILENRLEMGPEVKEIFAHCLLCRACTVDCFPGIRTDEVVVSFRHGYAERFGRGVLQRGVFRSLLPRPRLMRALVRFVWAFRRTGLVEAARRLGLVGLISPKLERALELGADKPGALLTSRLAHRQTQGVEVASHRPRLGYWMSCGYNYILPEVGEATVRVLERLGYRVEILDNCCCGLAAYSYGDLEGASLLARENLRRVGDVSGFEAIVSECGSCSGHLKTYGSLLGEDPQWQAQAAALQSKVRSFSEFVAERGIPGLFQALDQTRQADAGVHGSISAEAEQCVVTYHDPCHLGGRYQGVVSQPREILRSLPGVRFREMNEADSCCGAAGTYGVLHPDISASVIDRKTEFVRASGASIVATECPSCMMQLKYGAHRAGLPIEVVNISQLCDRATAG